MFFRKQILRWKFMLRAFNAGTLWWTAVQEWWQQDWARIVNRGSQLMADRPSTANVHWGKEDDGDFLGTTHWLLRRRYNPGRGSSLLKGQVPERDLVINYVGKWVPLFQRGQGSGQHPTIATPLCLTFPSLRSKFYHISTSFLYLWTIVWVNDFKAKTFVLLEDLLIVTVCLKNKCRKNKIELFINQAAWIQSHACIFWTLFLSPVPPKDSVRYIFKPLLWEVYLYQCSEWTLWGFNPHLGMVSEGFF